MNTLNYMKEKIPDEVIEAALLLTAYFAENNIKVWKIAGVQNREDK